MEKIIAIDFSGTLIKPEIAELASKKRFQILQTEIPKNLKQMLADNKHYDLNKEQISRLTNIKKNMKIKYNTNSKQQVELTGEQILTQIMTNLFQFAMYQVAKEKDIFPKNLIEILKKIKSKGYKLAIVSGIREDIISGMLNISNCTIIDYIFGQNPILSYSNKELLNKIKGKIEYVIGDKLSDIQPAKELKAKSIFVKWGHPTGGEEKLADFTIKKPKELLEIIK
ncbi:hypothetical protein CL618_00335 [archaeon]|nr:hypothetical protein [archaeon]|tara:strand:+ start:691 stop:1368 length:678 start_codon:yes stop_codon:yes gene_type:complete